MIIWCFEDFDGGCKGVSPLHDFFWGIFGFYDFGESRHLVQRINSLRFVTSFDGFNGLIHQSVS